MIQTGAEVAKIKRASAHFCAAYARRSRPGSLSFSTPGKAKQFACSSANAVRSFGMTKDRRSGWRSPLRAGGVVRHCAGVGGGFLPLPICAAVRTGAANFPARRDHLLTLDNVDAAGSGYSFRMRRPKCESYRSLELLCRSQAAMSTTPETRTELERMALEYKRMADWLERQWPEDEQK
jgi:hypothetical protein